MASALNSSSVFDWGCGMDSELQEVARRAFMLSNCGAYVNNGGDENDDVNDVPPLLRMFQWGKKDNNNNAAADSAERKRSAVNSILKMLCHQQLLLQTAQAMNGRSKCVRYLRI